MSPTESSTSPILSSTTTTANSPRQFPKSKLVFISMTVLLSLLLIFFITSSASTRHRHASTAHREVCRASRNPTACQASLTNSPTVLLAVQSAVAVSSRNLDTAVGMVQDVLADRNRSDAARTCLEILRYARHRMNLTGEALAREGGLGDARAWASGALAYEYGCMAGLKSVNETETAGFLNSSLIPSTSDVLGMLASYSAFGEKTELWAPPRTEREGFWEPLVSYSSSSSSSSYFSRGVELGLEANVSVCREGGPCDYGTVQEAVDAAPNNSDWRFVIGIKAGVYEETVRVPLEKKNVVLLGQGMANTVITANASVAHHGLTTYNTATVGVLGDGFMASGLTIQNTAGPDAHQAVAFRSDSDLSIIQNCQFIGNQDTLYAHSLRQYYKSCRILGNIDFIFGHSASFFEDCLILVTPRQVDPEKGENNVVTAHARIDPGQSTGFVFRNCVINGTDAYMRLYHAKPGVHKNFLGRPWKEYSRTVFINCTLEALIAPDGWMPWDGDFAFSTLYFGEFGNTGPGSNVSGRVNWSSQIPTEHVNSYTLENFIQGDRWVTASS
ncbi:Probable pectinesterase/pectinesterase inhibitor 51 [Striga hermonthica]|uniref:pectinesterase n=1 Tax=Striga hermonthica TaxID=68872 RepID=A0A9N7N576_STRHE|nr:Probable pectinesterase/pectinesterase inhibitor 51 [Striga hermonthica]